MGAAGHPGNVTITNQIVMIWTKQNSYLLPVEGSADGAAGRDLVRVLDELLGADGRRAGDVLQLLLGLVDGGGQQRLRLLQLGGQGLGRVQESGMNSVFIIE